MYFLIFQICNCILIQIKILFANRFVNNVNESFPYSNISTRSPRILWDTLHAFMREMTFQKCSENYRFLHLSSIQGIIAFLHNFNWRTMMYSFLFLRPLVMKCTVQCLLGTQGFNSYPGASATLIMFGDAVHLLFSKTERSCPV